ncbi:four-carbon acid sugar kinase family protein [Pseudaquabacterium rugosum]|uniref:Four-carbon acid sugar kinase family protein n=1 Tax=Pseudaquabacterium rugosum TaxID=2984194 RepID=A0ABU9BGU9_9BURK
MTPDLRILADDLTGALDTAAAFVAPVPVHLDHPPAVPVAAPVSALAIASRDVPPARLPALLAPAADWLAGAGIAYKKIDSLWRGNTLDELVWLVRAGGFERLIFAPAFPAQGRLCIGGRLRLADGRPPPAADDANGLRERLPGVQVDLPDVRDEADLQAVAGQVHGQVHGQGGRRWLWCGSAGLAQALARELACAAGGRAASESASSVRAMTMAASSEAGTAAGVPGLLLISASHQDVTRGQLDRLQADWPRATWVRDGDAAALDAVLAPGAAARALARGGLLLDLAPRGRLTPEAAAALLAAQIGRLTQAQALPRPARLVVIGGDTFVALCRATGATALHTEPARQAGWGRARWAGGAWDGVVCDSRSGAFGGPDDLRSLLGTGPA